MYSGKRWIKNFLGSIGDLYQGEKETAINGMGNEETAAKVCWAKCCEIFFVGAGTIVGCGHLGPAPCWEAKSGDAGGGGVVAECVQEWCHQRSQLWALIG